MSDEFLHCLQCPEMLKRSFLQLQPCCYATILVTMCPGWEGNLYVWGGGKTWKGFWRERLHYRSLFTSTLHLLNIGGWKRDHPSFAVAQQF